MNLQNSVFTSLGGIGGFTVKFGQFELDMNMEDRVRPSAFIPTSKYNDVFMSVSFSYKGTLF